MIVPAHVLAAIRQPAFVYRREGIVEAANDCAEALAGGPLAGMTPAEIVACFNVRHRDGAPVLPNDLPAGRALRGEEVVNVPLTVATADGRTVHVLATASPIRNSDTVAGSLSVWQEVTAQVDAETALAAESEAQARQAEEIQVQTEELQAQNEELRCQADELRALHDERVQDHRELDRQHRLLDAVLGVLPYRVSLWGRDGVLLWGNEVFFANRGVHRDDLVGRPWQALGGDAAVVEPLVREGFRVLGSGAPLSREVEVVGPDGSEWRAVTVLPFSTDALLVVTGDITERKAAERALEESEGRYRDLIETNVDFVWEMDAQGRYTYCSPQMETLWALRPEEMIGRTPFDQMPPIERERAIEAFMEMAKAPGGFRGLESIAIDGRGNRIVIETSGIPFFDGDGVLLGFRGVTRDITERKRVEEDEARLRTLMDHNPCMVFLKDEEGRYVYLNETYERQFVHRKDWQGRTDSDFWPEESAELFRENDRAVLASGTTHQFMEDSTDLDGTRYVWLNYKFPFVDAQGRRYVGGIGIDATARVRAEEALAESEARFRDILGNSLDALYRRNLRTGRFDYFSAAVEPITGYPVKEVLAWSADAILGRVHPDDQARVSSEKMAAPPSALGRTIEYRFMRPDGTYTWLSDRFRTIPDADGRPLYRDGILRDITDRKRAEEALQKSEAEYRHIVEYAPTGIYELDYTGPAFRRVNDAMCEILGYAREELLAMDPGVLMDEESRERFRERVGTILAGEPVDESVAYRLFTRDGQEIWAELNVKPTFTDGVMDGALVVAHDITERKRAEEALRESEEQFRRAIEDAPIPIIMHAEDGQVLQLSRTWTELTGYGPEDVPTFDAWLNRAYGEGADAVRNHVQSLFSGDARTIDIEFPVRTRDGRTRYWSFSASSPGTLADGRRFVVGMAVDITRRKAAEAALKESEERQAFLLALNDVLAPLADPGEVQAAAARVLGEHLGADRVVYFEVDDGDYVVEHDYAPSVPHIAGRHPIASFGARLLETYRSGTTAVGADVEADPELSPAEKAGFAAIQTRAYIGVPLVKAGAFVAGVGVHMATPREWTPEEVALVEETAERTWAAVERARAEAALRSHAENLRRSNEDLERFAYVASHDLQEPLRSIVSFTQLLDRRYRGRLDAEADEYIDFIVEGGTRMQGLILDLLAFSRVNTTRQQIARTDAEAVLSEAERSLDAQLRKAEATLTHGPLPVVMADPIQLAQVFANLVSNAIKFRKPDMPLRIHVGARRLDGFWEFSVKDNGIGIEKEYFEKIFVIFQRLHTKDAYPGTGIGLAIVKRIVDRHGGTIRVESTPGEGSTFYFTLPAA